MKKRFYVIANMGFSEPTKIQELAIPKILQGNEDIIALAQTGTGKQEHDFHR